MGGCGEEWETGKTKGHEETFGGDGYVHYLNCKEMYTPGKTYQIMKC